VRVVRVISSSRVVQKNTHQGDGVCFYLKQRGLPQGHHPHTLTGHRGEMGSDRLEDIIRARDDPDTDDRSIISHLEGMKDQEIRIQSPISRSRSSPWKPVFWREWSSG